MKFNPRLVAFDFIFSGKSDPWEDFLLTQAIQKSGKVVLASYVDQEKNHITPLQSFREAASGYGVVNKSLDPDLYVRRAIPVYRDERGNIAGWLWEIEILKALYQLREENLEVTPRGVQLRGSNFNLLIPSFDSRGVVINYRFKLNDLPHIPFWHLFENGNLKDRLEGKIVLAGATSRLLHDYYHTPLGLMPGVVVNANLLANLLAKDFLRPLPYVFNLLFISLSVFLAAYLGFKADVLRGLLILILSTASLKAAFFTFFLNGFLGDLFSPILGGWAAFVVITFYRYFKTFLENVQLRGKVITDPLTGLYNRRVLESQIDLELENIANVKGTRKTDPFYELSIVMIDIDNFKRINDTYGHQFGDDVLKNVAFSIKESTRKDDLAARFGGEEFCVVLPHTNKDEAREIAEKIRRNVEAKKMSYVNQMMTFTVSAGVAAAKADQLLSSRALIRAADRALYQAKEEGKNKVCLYDRKNT